MAEINPMPFMSPDPEDHRVTASQLAAEAAHRERERLYILWCKTMLALAKLSGPEVLRLRQACDARHPVTAERAAEAARVAAHLAPGAVSPAELRGLGAWQSIQDEMIAPLQREACPECRRRHERTLEARAQVEQHPELEPALAEQLWTQLQAGSRRHTVACGLIRAAVRAGTDQIGRPSGAILVSRLSGVEISFTRIRGAFEREIQAQIEDAYRAVGVKLG